MVGIHRQFAVLDARHTEQHLLAAIVLERDFGADAAMLRQHVGDVVGERLFGLDVAEAVRRRQHDLDAVADAPALERLPDFLEQRAVGAVHIAHRHVVLFEQVAGLVEDRVDETNHLVARNGEFHECPVAGKRALNGFLPV
jgi:hypothetical protein